jgi:hypothetical protein
VIKEEPKLEQKKQNTNKNRTNHPKTKTKQNRTLGESNSLIKRRL